MQYSGGFLAPAKIPPTMQRLNIIQKHGRSLAHARVTLLCFSEREIVGQMSTDTPNISVGAILVTT